ncbi:hypothetical protein HELRODRAFT_176118 [Helobdella robusta]|uniref:Uncharacterized protein n=1 Tax=Helobdella robusta TaxID=6412 RepID=T1FA58_HELRO|nr:hypothetical protein HELRODRAFT_176118 [Helobdella robusta]ESO00260.1 hypothetical protein HELRODRAFT_176118 [Helobdella robusta]
MNTTTLKAKNFGNILCYTKIFHTQIGKNSFYMGGGFSPGSICPEGNCSGGIFGIFLVGEVFVLEVAAGSSLSNDSKISTYKINRRRCFYYVSNVKKCYASDIVDHMKMINIETVSYFLCSEKCILVKSSTSSNRRGKDLHHKTP